MGAKNNDSTSEKQVIVIFYTMEYRKCGNSNSKNDSRLCMGAYAIPQSVDFRAFAVNVKTIVPTQKLYQSGHAIWWNNMPMPVFTFLEGYDFSGKTVIPFTTHGNGVWAKSIDSIQGTLQNAIILDGLAIQEHELQDAPAEVSEWLQEFGFIK